MKKMILVVLLLTIGVVAQTNSNLPPEMFSSHQGSMTFSTAIINEGDSLYTYQFVAIESISESDMMNALLSDFNNRTDGDISFAQYNARSQERVRFALQGYVDNSNAAACGFDTGITEAEMKTLLGVVDYR